NSPHRNSRHVLCRQSNGSRDRNYAAFQSMYARWKSFMPDRPLVSVIIPAFNAECFIRHTLRSVLAQSYRRIEVLTVDDGSCDSTPDIIEGFAAKDPRVKLLRQRNRGVAAARNLAIARSEGKFVAPVDADDIWFPLKIEKQLQRFEQ